MFGCIAVTAAFKTTTTISNAYGNILITSYLLHGMSVERDRGPEKHKI